MFWASLDLLALLLNRVWTKSEFEIIGWTKFEHNVNMALLTALDWNKLWTKFAVQIWPWKRQNKDWTYYEWSLNFNELIWTMYEQSLNWNIVWTLFEQSLNRVWTNHEFYVQTLFKPTLVRSTLYCAITCVKRDECGAFYYDQNGCYHSQFKGEIIEATSGSPKAIYVREKTTTITTTTAAAATTTTTTTISKYIIS